MKKDSKMAESLLFSTIDEDFPQQSANLGPWLQSPHKTIDHPQPKFNFSRRHLLQRKDKKETTSIKLPLIVNKTLIFNMAVDQSNLQWHPRIKRKNDERQVVSGKCSVLVSRSMDYRKNPSPPSLQLLSLGKRKNKKDSGLCVTGIPTTYLL